MLKVNQTLHGFKVVREYPVPELCATLYEMDYEKNGAKLYFLDREDDNKTFAIGFKTIPEDDTGVFHIIEHSVLCGSEKYPVKEPFVELLKGSLQTFLNAITFPDKTVYPVATRNDKDFLNLMSVYMDAVLHPAILHNPNIFRQEGWHYELDGENLVRKGVVYNEMKGAYSSPDTLSTYNIMDMLYPDTCYSCESGGSPESIPDLTYEQFLAAHAKYYHPSNSQIFLDGSVNLDDALSLIDSFLCEYDRLDIDFDIGDQESAPEQRREIEYEIAPTESEENKTRISLGFLSARFDESAKNTAYTVLFDALCSSNESPLKRRIIESGLCEDVYLGNNDGIKRQCAIINFSNVKDGKADELIELFYSSVKEICEQGIDKELLEASLNIFEFKSRERDFGSFPKGVLFAMNVAASSLYGGDPTQELRFNDTFAFLREALSGDYYERTLSELITENKSRATLIMTPSKTLGERREAKDREWLANYKATLSDEELENIKKIAEEIELWQKTPDTQEQLATIPALTLDDIPGEIERIPTELVRCDGVNVLRHDINTEGITYVNMYIDASDLTEEEIFLFKLYVALAKEVPTERYDVISLQKRIKSELGSLSVSMGNLNKKGEAKLYLQVNASALDSKCDSLVDLVREVLLTSKYNQKEVLINLLRQSKLSAEEFFVGAGHAAALSRTKAAIMANGVIDEYYNGYEAYVRTKALVASYDERFDGVIAKIEEIRAKLLNKNRLTVGITGAVNPSLEKELANMLPDGDKTVPVCNIQPLGVRKEGIVIPAQISYAVMSANLASVGKGENGAYHVARSLLSYAHLWNSVRVQGGAYGSGFIYTPATVSIGFYSYRDPTPVRSLSCYKQSSDFLRAFGASGEDMTKFIIGAVGETTPLLTPSLKGRLADSRYLTDTTPEEIIKGREELLNTDSAALLEIADTLDALYDNAPVCIVASKEKLSECPEGFLDNILYL